MTSFLNFVSSEHFTGGAVGYLIIGNAGSGIPPSAQYYGIRKFVYTATNIADQEGGCISIKSNIQNSKNAFISSGGFIAAPTTAIQLLGTLDQTPPDEQILVPISSTGVYTFSGGIIGTLTGTSLVITNMGTAQIYLGAPMVTHSFGGTLTLVSQGIGTQGLTGTYVCTVSGTTNGGQSNIVWEQDGFDLLSFWKFPAAGPSTALNPMSSVAEACFYSGIPARISQIVGPLDSNNCIKVDIQDYNGTIVSSTNPVFVNQPTIAATQIFGTVAVSNLPTTLNANGNLKVDLEDYKGTVASNSNPIFINQPATQPISGSISISNFPATQPISGTVSVSNLPVTQPVSGTIAISNFPSSTTISNFPATQPVSGSVSVTNFPTSTTVSNFPVTQPISGGVSVNNLPATQNVVITGPLDSRGFVQMDIEDYLGIASSNTNPLFISQTNVPATIAISNFPVTQPVSGNVGVTNFPTSTIVSNFPVTQPISGSVSVSNLPATQNVVITGPLDSRGFVQMDIEDYLGSASSLTNPLFTQQTNVPSSISVSNFPSTQNVSGSVSVTNFPSSTTVSNFPAVQSILGSISVNNLPASQNVVITGPLDSRGFVQMDIEDYLGAASSSTNPLFISQTNVPASIQVSNFPSTQNISGNVAVTNLPATQPISGSVAINNFPLSQTVNGSVSVSNLPSTQNVVITGPLDSRGFVQMDLEDYLGSAIGASNPQFVSQTNVPSSIQVSNFPASQPISGSVSVSNFPSTQNISGSVSVSNLPSTQNVIITGPLDSRGFVQMDLEDYLGSAIGATNPQFISGNVSVANFPVTQPISGNISVSNFPALQDVNVQNFPTLQNVDVQNFPALQNVAISNFPTSQTINGTISVANFPASQSVTGSVSITNLPLDSNGNLMVDIEDISGIPQSVANPLNITQATVPTGQIVQVSNFPSIQAVSGTIAVNNFPASTQVSNFPTSQDVAITSYPSPLAVNVAQIGGQAQVSGSLGVAIESPLDSGGNVKVSSSDSTSVLNINLKQVAGINVPTNFL